jgi:alginate O-acetyltransferase complex protein AlgI
MLFPTFPFLVFFGVVFAVYWSLRGRRVRHVWLLIASVYFYASWNPWLVGLIAFSASVDYFVALVMERQASLGRRRLLLLLSVGTNLGLLAYFKYVNFFLDMVGGTRLNVILPLGISFYTFETISYIVDVYRGRIRAVRSLLDYALYIMFFPHLVCGPIVRPAEFLPQLKRRMRFNWLRAEVGVWLFAVGAFKKAVLADHVAAVIDPVFAGPAGYGTSAAWAAILGYAAQVYCDFSGYSDMALGLAHLFGFHLPVNFRLPYFAANIGEVWRRWHISLSTWLRDYLYVPLGGGRGGTWKACRNLIVTMGLGGLWHGANWPSVLWGLYHGLLLAGHRALPKPRWLGEAWAKPFAVGLTFLCFCVGLAIFRCHSAADGVVFLTHMFWPIAGKVLAPTELRVVIAVVGAVLCGHLIGTFVDLGRLEQRLPEFAVTTALACLLVVTLVLLPETGSAFIYFQF